MARNDMSKELKACMNRPGYYSGRLFDELCTESCCPDSPSKEYLVSYNVIGRQTIRVQAKSKAEAIKMALNNEGEDLDFFVEKRLPTTAKANEI